MPLGVHESNKMIKFVFTSCIRGRGTLLNET